MTTTPKTGTQTDRVLRTLLSADGQWVSGSYFLRELYISQFHARLYDLENKFGWKGRIEHSEHPDEHGFVQFRIVNRGETLSML